MAGRIYFDDRFDFLADAPAQADLTVTSAVSDVEELLARFDDCMRDAVAPRADVLVDHRSWEARSDSLREGLRDLADPTVGQPKQLTVIVE